MSVNQKNWEPERTGSWIPIFQKNIELLLPSHSAFGKHFGIKLCIIFNLEIMLWNYDWRTLIRYAKLYSRKFAIYYGLLQFALQSSWKHMIFLSKCTQKLLVVQALLISSANPIYWPFNPSGKLQPLSQSWQQPAVYWCLFFKKSAGGMAYCPLPGFCDMFSSFQLPPVRSILLICFFY